MDSALDVISSHKGPSPFSTITVNFGPRTVCLPHRDLKNLAYGWCAIVVLGNFDFELGGHLVLHELKLIVEMRPGDIIFIPSAVVTHENIPIGRGEWRKSLVYYSPGGIFRWAAAGYRSHEEWKKKDMAGWKRHHDEGEKRWQEGWNLFRSFSCLVEAKGQSH